MYYVLFALLEVLAALMVLKPVLLWRMLHGFSKTARPKGSDVIFLRYGGIFLAMIGIVFLVAALR